MVSSLRSIAMLGVGLLTPLVLASCGGGDDPPPPTEPPTTGTIAVTVTAEGSGVPGVTVNLYADGSSTITTTQTTNNSGVATFANVDEGAWDVEVEPPAGFGLDAGEVALKSATVTAGATANASFALVDTFQGEEVSAIDFEFSPVNLSVSVGTSVRWTNNGGTAHNVTPDGHSEWSSLNLGTGATTAPVTFDTPGTFNYECTIHTAQNMVGTITVS